MQTVLQIFCARKGETCFTRQTCFADHPAGYEHKTFFVNVKHVLHFVCKRPIELLQNRFYECKTCFACAKQVLPTVLQVFCTRKRKHVLQSQNMFCFHKTCFTLVKQALLFIIQLTCHRCSLSRQDSEIK